MIEETIKQIQSMGTPGWIIVGFVLLFALVWILNFIIRMH